MFNMFKRFLFVSCYITAKHFSVFLLFFLHESTRKQGILRAVGPSVQHPSKETSASFVEHLHPDVQI